MPIELEKRELLKKFIKEVPIKIKNPRVKDYYMTSDEYLECEKWVENLIEKINPSWEDIEKLLFIHSQIAKQFSFDPLYKSEIFNPNDCRAFGKIVSSGFGVCDGFSNFYIYIVKTLEQKMQFHTDFSLCSVSGKEHTFLLAKNLKIPKKDGSYSIANTLIDPTWDLGLISYGFEPDFFGRSLENIRKFDFLHGEDQYCHKANVPQTEEVDDEVFLNLCKNIGLCDRRFVFEASFWMNRVNDISNSNYGFDQKLENILNLFPMWNPKFAVAINSTIETLATIFYKQKNLEYEQIKINRVYEKEDEKKNPICAIYVKTNKTNYFYIANPKENKMQKMQKEEFVDKFACYQMDIKKTMKNFWESDNKKEREL